MNWRVCTFRALVVLATFGSAASASAQVPRPATPAEQPPSIFQQGNMSVGLSGGGSAGFIQVGARYGYFVYDGLRLAGSFTYRYQDFTPGIAHEIEPGIDLRYYWQIPGSQLALFPLVEATLIHVLFEDIPPLDDSYTYFTVAPGGGIFYQIGQHVGFELSAAALWFLGYDQILEDIGYVSDKPQFRWSFGVSVFF